MEEYQSLQEGETRFDRVALEDLGDSAGSHDGVRPENHHASVDGAMSTAEARHQQVLDSLAESQRKQGPRRRKTSTLQSKANLRPALLSDGRAPSKLHASSSRKLHIDPYLQ